MNDTELNDDGGELIVILVIVSMIILVTLFKTMIFLLFGYVQLDYNKYDQNEDHCDASDNYAGLIVGISQRFIHSQHTHRTKSSSPLSSSLSTYLGSANQSKQHSNWQLPHRLWHQGWYSSQGCKVGINTRNMVDQQTWTLSFQHHNFFLPFSSDETTKKKIFLAGLLWRPCIEISLISLLRKNWSEWSVNWEKSVIGDQWSDGRAERDGDEIGDQGGKRPHHDHTS